MAAIIEATKPRSHEAIRLSFCHLCNITNEHILKEHGIIAYGMSEYCGCDSFIATCENGDYPNLKYIPGVRIEFIPKKNIFRSNKLNFIIASCLWLMKNARRIDVLSLMHPVLGSFFRAFTYKLFNPGGKVYVKFDGAYPKHGRGSLWKRPFYNWLMKHADCASTELEGNDEIMSREWGRRVLWIPNPAVPHELEDFRPFSERSNTILTVGRLGTRQKATEILLEAFALISDKIPGWTLKLAGRIEENMSIASDFYAKYPGLHERVVFTGEIRDRAQLLNEYREAKVFAFPSRWESFGIALTEAMMQGDFAVVSRIPASEYLTNGYRFALSSNVDDVDGLAENLLHACTHEDETERLALEGMNTVRSRLDLKRACEAIEREMN